MDDALLLDAPWPDDLDPATILRRMGHDDDPSLCSNLTEAEVLSWWKPRR